ncbi:putative RNA-binding protein (Nab3) [Aspergillus undulatus]|uniref:putative RNA-binding protein (Nab3) n=1 Tax=Aspergillus undulatus TaxID=1810928 RepID=UPI003CCD9DB9
MTPDSPDEALHFRGKTLTPESPRPLHVAEPASIPVLQNQMDPVFNDTSTYGQAEYLYENNHYTNPSGNYTRSGEVTGDTGGQPQRPPQHQSHIQGSLQSGPLLVNDGLMGADTTSTSPSSAATAALLPSLSNPVLSSNSSEPSSVAKVTADFFLTACPPSDPSSPLTQPVPGAPSFPSHAARNNPFVNGVDHSVAASQSQPAPQGRLDAEERPEDNAGNGVDFQNLLDNLPSSSTSPSAPTLSGNTVPADDTSASPQASTDEATQSSLGLPPRPPPQEKPSIHPNYNPSDDIRSYHQLPGHAAPNNPNPYAAQQGSYQSNVGLPAITAGAPGTSSGAGSLPPPPVASFQQSPSAPMESQETPAPVTQKNSRIDSQPPRKDDDAPWGADVQKKYDSFLHDERIYVTEGLWDRFPYGSRLFVGNLPTERVTKRDLFHIFHSYGKLAQISIKQAYGFIQFLEAPACKRALEKEQGAIVRGRKVHLEISKPQRNTKPAPAPSEPSRPPPRRSRSPEYSRNGPPSNRSSRAPADRFDRPHESGRLPFSDFRDEPTHRRREGFRSPRSPSPRGYRPREGYRSRDRTPERFDRRRRSRSPFGRDRRYRSPSPRGRANYNSDADLPIPRRAPRDVPDVQILVLEELDRHFVFHVESSFRNRGLRVDVLVLGPRIPLDAAVKRQISEGVLAVVRLSRPSQISRKIPLQVFDRSSGPNNVQFNEFPDVEPSVAASIVVQAQSMQRNAPNVPLPSPAYGVPPIPSAPLPHPVPPTLPNQPNLANAISHLDGAGLQSLLAALQQQRSPTLQQPAQQPFSASSTPDLASLLSAATRQPVPLNPPQPPLPQQQFPLQSPNPAAISDPNLLSLLAKGLGGPQPQGQPAIAPNQVQNIMSQLGKWKQ